MKEKSEITRRGFLKLMGTGGSAVAGLQLLSVPGFAEILKEEIAQVPVVWIQVGACSGCSVSLLNSASPTIQDLILGQVIPGKHVSLAYHPDVMAAQGELAVGVLDKFKKKENKGKFVLVYEGGVSTKDDGVYCEIGEKHGHGITGLKHLKDLAPNALAVISAGTCSSYGGIPAAPPNPTGIVPVTDVLKKAGIKTPVVNLPGCPTHPDRIVGTVAMLLIGGLGYLAKSLDAIGRPKPFYGKLTHDNCERRGQFDKGNFAKKYSDYGCLYELGCKGPVSYCDSPKRRWNGATNWCIGAGSPCIGCVEPFYMKDTSLLKKVDLTMTPANYPPITSEQGSGASTLAVGAIGVAAGVAAGAAISNSKKSDKGE